MTEGKNKELFEATKRLNESSEGGEFHCPYPFIVSAVFQKFGIQNANGRIYPESVLKKFKSTFGLIKVTQLLASYTLSSKECSPTPILEAQQALLLYESPFIAAFNAFKPIQSLINSVFFSYIDNSRSICNSFNYNH